MSECVPAGLVKERAEDAESGCQPALDSQRANRLPVMLSAAKWLLDCNGCYALRASCMSA